MNKKISIFIITLLLLPSIFLGKPKITNAQFVVTDPGNTITNIANTGGTIWDVARNEVLIPILKAAGNRLKEKVQQDVTNWAAGGFQDSSGFINDYKGFFKNIEHGILDQTLNSAIGAANTVAQRNQYRNDPELSAKYDICVSEVTQKAITAEEEELEICDLFESGSEDYIQCENDAYKVYLSVYTPGQQNCQKTIFSNNFTNVAIENWNIYSSGEADAARNVAKNIATYGAGKLNNDTVNNLINGGGKTIDKVTGSKQATEVAKSDLRSLGAKGFEYLLGLSDPHNFESGFNAIVIEAVEGKVTKETTTKKDDLQTPEKTLDKKKCVEYEKDVSGKRTSECAREVATTVGSLVSSKLKNALVSGENSIDDNTNSLVGALINGLTQLTTQLIDKGVTGLATNVSSTVSNSAVGSVINDFAANNGNYQSQFDVLGLAVDNSNNGNSTVTISGNNTNRATGDSSIVGGPEDVGGWNNSPQIIIDFQENLEKQILLAKEEESYYKLNREIVARGEDTGKYLDQCIPGPDYGWEERYNDSFSGEQDDEKRQIIRIAQNELKELINDPSVTIPGGVDLQQGFINTLNQGKQEKAENESRRKALNNVITTTAFIKQEILTDFNSQKSEIDPELVIFNEDWVTLTPGTQFNLFEKAVSNGFALVPKDTTPEKIFNLEPEKAEKAVLSMAWDLWRKKTPKQEKTDLRYSYHILNSMLSNEQFIAQARAKYNNLQTVSIQNEYNLADCLVLKAYTLGVPESTISSIVKSTKTSNVDIVAAENNKLRELIDNLPRITRNGYVRVLDDSKGKTDSQIKSFIEREKVKQSNSQQILLKTNYVTSGIPQSILRFKNETEKKEYFDLYYPDDDFNDDIIKNKLSILDIFVNDRFTQGYRRYSGERGGLFCRINIKQDLWHGGPFDLPRSLCIRNDWYIASELDYATAFSGI